jgi:hypothetical protein
MATVPDRRSSLTSGSEKKSAVAIHVEVWEGFAGPAPLVVVLQPDGRAWEQL